jgi:glycogen phosphorylase
MSARKSKWPELTSSDEEMTAEAIKRSFAGHVEYRQAKDQYSVNEEDFFKSLAYTIRDRMLDRWNRTQRAYYETDQRRVYYLSLEFLIGRLARNALLNLDMTQQAKEALEAFGLDIGEVLDEEWDAGLGNGGLGRLAACFLDSMATLGLPAMGYGILYQYGIFRQQIVDGRQLEVPNNWLRFGSSWVISRPDFLLPIRFYGRVLSSVDERGGVSYDWVDTQNVLAMPNDILVPGYRNDVVNTLRLWSAKSSYDFDFANFNRGDYLQAVRAKILSENISWVLYPNDQVREGQELRLKQEYFLVSATLQDALRRHLKLHRTARNLHEKAVFQLNDTHPALAVSELMRLLVDDEKLDWDEAWSITTKAMAYTNHTILPEALESWPVDLLGYVLPRNLQIIYEINYRFLDEVRRRFPGDEGRVQRMSIIGEGPVRTVRMANLALVGSYSVNGVSKLHSGLVRDRLFPDFAEMYPERFNNKTNGVAPRRWIAACNPAMSGLIIEKIGDGWIRDLPRIEAIAPLAEDAAFRAAWQAAKLSNKTRFALWLEENLGVKVDPTSMFDVQVKRIHEYKRQLLNVFYVLHRYLALKKGIGLDLPARTVLISGKAAPGYDIAKRIIHLINAVGTLINNDEAIGGRLKLLFLPNYSVSLAEAVIPAADLSEQISTAGLEASGTGNMKLAMNGALTIGTRDGANIEIGEAVSEENIYFFGLSKAEVDAVRSHGYRPRDIYDENTSIREIIHLIGSGSLTPDEPLAFVPIIRRLLDEGDQFLVLADFDAYVAAQHRVDTDFQDSDKWARMSILNTALTSRFSSDITIANYAREIWKTGAMSAESDE